jgi:hypothetical protein
MSRSNTNYYNVCDRPIGESGYCERHSPARSWQPRKVCIPPGEFWTRRGLVRRESRYQHGWKRHCSGPPRAMKRAWQRQLRAKYVAEFRREGEILFDGGKWLAGQYSRWS